MLLQLRLKNEQNFIFEHLHDYSSTVYDNIHKYSLKTKKMLVKTHYNRFTILCFELFKEPIKFISDTHDESARPNPAMTPFDG